MSFDKSFRTKTESLDAPGPDYFCGKCGAWGLRLWRESHVTLEHVRLRCEACATTEQVIPARPTPEGDTFWGHTSGDVDWWRELPARSPGGSTAPGPKEPRR